MEKPYEAIRKPGPEVMIVNLLFGNFQFWKESSFVTTRFSERL